MVKMEIQNISIKDITPYEKNPRKNEAAVAPVMESIKEFGFKSPIIIVDKDMIIINGHTRFKAAKRLQMETVPVIIATDLTPEQVKSFRLADNKTAEFAEWDFDLLDGELKDILNMDMSAFGFDEIESDEEREPQEDDYDPAVPATSKSKPGDIYQLGEHRLMCGDSTNEKDIWALMDAESADMLLTDPPYNVDYEGKMKEKLKIKSDNMAAESFIEFLRMAFTNAKGVMRQGAAFYIWHANMNQKQFQTALKDAGLQLRETIILAKQVFALGRQDYQWIHESCLYGWTDGAAHYFVDKKNLTTAFEDILNDTLKMVYHSAENAYDILTDVEEKNLDSCDITIPYAELKKGIRYPILFDALKNQCRFVFTGWTEGKFYRSEVFHNVFDNVYMDADKLNMMSANIYNCNYIMENIEID